MQKMVYPNSFPNIKEQQFLELLVCDVSVFPKLWQNWKLSNRFEETDHATAKLFPLLYVRLNTFGFQDDELFLRIRGMYKNAWVKNQRLLGATKDILRICQEKNIPVLILKGIPLLLEVYHDRGARFLGDADILIPPEHAPTVVALLFAHGWKYDKSWTPDANNPVSSMYRVVKSTSFVNRQGLKMDIHWNIFGLLHHARTLDVLLLKDVSSVRFRDAVWQDAVPSAIDGVPCQKLCAEDMLIHIVIHGSEGNSFRPLRWTIDALYVMQKFSIDWQFICRRAKQFGFTLELTIGFKYLKEHMHADIPEYFFCDMERISVTKQEKRIYYHFANVCHSERFSLVANIALLWYAYGMYEPMPRSVIKLLVYLKASLGDKTMKYVFLHIVKRYRRLFYNL